MGRNRNKKKFQLEMMSWKSNIVCIFIYAISFLTLNRSVVNGNITHDDSRQNSGVASTIGFAFHSIKTKKRKETFQSKQIKHKSTKKFVLYASSNEKDTKNKNIPNMDPFEKVKDEKFMERAKRWIIFVDDEESIRLAVGDFLYDQGYQVTACADADALLEILHVDSNDNDSNEIDHFSEDGNIGSNMVLPPIPDVIISDIRMPGKDGLELVKLIRADERLSRVPIVLLTAKSLTRDRILGYRVGADIYLPKPFDPDELLSIVDNLIVRRKQMAEGRGELMDLKDDMADIKLILKRNSNFVVKETDVYLTPIERETLELLCKGFSNAEIAEERKVNKNGVDRCIQVLYSKTETRTRTELVRWALKTGQISRKLF